jgi:23S rRNA pseudouridine2605 synthase
MNGCGGMARFAEKTLLSAPRLSLIDERAMTRKSAPQNTGERIAKVMARAGLCSRREAETWIAAGRVAVNGKTIASPALNVGSRDRITVDGRALPARERTRLFLFHKPRGLVTTNADPEGRPTIFDALPKDLPRLVSVGRLDLNTEGLLLLTNDGGLARMLELPRTGWLRRYRVRAHGSVTQEALDRLRDGITVDGIRYGPIDATLDRVQGSNIWLTFAMREGKNREIRSVLGELGLKVNRLIRVSYGPFQLGELPDGAVDEVKTRVLRDQIGERIARLAGADFAGPLQPSPNRTRVYPSSTTIKWPKSETSDFGWGESGEHRAKRDASRVRGPLRKIRHEDTPSPGPSLRSGPPSPPRGEGKGRPPSPAKRGRDKKPPKRRR